MFKRKEKEMVKNKISKDNNYINNDNENLNNTSVIKTNKSKNFDADDSNFDVNSNNNSKKIGPLFKPNNSNKANKPENNEELKNLN